LEFWTVIAGRRDACLHLLRAEQRRKKRPYIQASSEIWIHDFSFQAIKVHVLKSSFARMQDENNLSYYLTTD
jgi:hypothetical protein